ncbi:MAG: class I poly(R)-hydroxyalkanoic acid synthase [Alcaligenaceae bacterium]|nr:class I poly(R)-hydroxyalkanoic acid synthase [Alcaligenaceae bacterium]
MYRNVNKFFPSSWPAPINVAPEALAQIQTEFSSAYAELLEQARTGRLDPPSDRRFRAEAWQANPLALLNAHLWELSARAMNRMVDVAQVDESLRNRLRFSVMQWLEATAPSNFVFTNPEVQQLMMETGGQSLARGMQNLLEDIGKGRMSQTDESGFQLGENIAITPGAVVYQNPIMQVIQYAPLTDTVHERPLVVVPPCINKYYILDLQPENSFVRHAVEQGHTVFLVSWRNPLPEDTDDSDKAGWGDYLEEGVLRALKVASDITRQPKVNALGFCVGGTMLASAVALAHAKGEQPLQSLTLLTTLLDFSDTGVIDVFIDENHVSMREQQMGQGGLLSARELATTFSFLRPSELVWNYVVNNYLKGMSPPAFDLLFWNADGTNLPGPFFTWYLRNTYLENRLCKPGSVQINGHAIDLGSLDMPAYVYASREDHIVPWQSAYASCNLLSGPRRFVMGASGHIAGVVNPPAKKRRSYWAVPDNLAAGESAVPADDWIQAAPETPGSWWPDWDAWLVEHAGARKKAPAKPGNTQYKVLDSAPGAYVKARAV